MTFTNKGKEKASILALVILPAESDHPPLIDYTAATPTADTFEGVTSQILGDAILTTIPSGPSTITINDVSLKPAQSLPGSRNPVLYSVVKGDCSFKVTGGSVQISRTEKPGPQNDTELNKDIELKPGDAMFYPNGLRTTSRGENSGSLELLQVLVEPASSDETLSEDNRGQVKFNQPSSPPAAEEGQFGIVRQFQGWRFGLCQLDRRQPTRLTEQDGGQVTVLIYGQELIIDGDPTDADSFTWWPVHIADSPDITGYVVSGLIQSEPVALRSRSLDRLLRRGPTLGRSASGATVFMPCTCVLRTCQVLVYLVSYSVRSAPLLISSWFAVCSSPVAANK